MRKQKIIGRQRLARLASFLYRVPREKFDMRQWATSDFDLTNQRCGTTACACGWAATIFRADKFRMVPAFFGTLPRVEYCGKANWDAVCAFFGMPFQHAVDLFGIEDDNTNNRELGPRQVSKRIKQYLKTGKVSKVSKT